MLFLDGAMGEGGGQVLRSALSLAMVTGQSFTLERVRANRPRPGLMRQHLTCVQGAAAICGAEVEGAALGSGRVVFRPGAPRAGDWRFEVGSAGSAGLVLQTVLPALWRAPGPSTVALTGGTHNASAPPFHFLEASFAPRVGLELVLDRWGFYPAGGGALRARVRPGGAPLGLTERGPLLEVHAHAAISAISHRIGHGALGLFRRELGLEGARLHFHQVPEPVGPGFATWIEARFAGGAAVFTAFGERRDHTGVAQQALEAFRAWEAQDVPVDEHLADQLMLPLALFGGAFRAGPLSLHARTNLEVIGRFWPGRLRVEADGTVRSVGAPL